jgi:acyl-CoA dehydrogenase
VHEETVVRRILRGCTPTEVPTEHIATRRKAGGYEREL